MGLKLKDFESYRHNLRNLNTLVPRPSGPFQNSICILSASLFIKNTAEYYLSVFTPGVVTLCALEELGFCLVRCPSLEGPEVCFFVPAVLT